MATGSLNQWQRTSLSIHSGELITEYFSGQHIPQWTKIGTEKQAELRRLLIQRLRDRKCSDVADYLQESKENATRAIQQRLKSLREKERKDGKRNVVGQY